MSKQAESPKDGISYEKSAAYWASQPATVDGMLGGLECVSAADVEQSQKFLDFFLAVILRLLTDAVSRKELE